MATKVTKAEKEIANKTVEKFGEIMDGLTEIDLNDLASTIKTAIKMTLNRVDELTFTNDPEDMMNLFFALGNFQEALDAYDNSPVFAFAVEDDNEE